jgi:hypothetical protein
MAAAERRESLVGDGRWGGDGDATLQLKATIEW